MPSLHWPSKALHDPSPAELVLEAVTYPHGQGYPLEEPKSHLILGDNLKVMPALLAKYEGKIDLIYADPPFFTNRRYPMRVGRGEDSRKPTEWQLSEGYADHWEDLDAYLDFLYPRLVWMHRLLSPTGMLYLHLDWHANAYARLILDEIFGRERLLNEIAWVYHGPSPIRSAFNRKHDTILVYTKSDRYTFNVDAIREPYNPSTVKTFEASKKAGFGKIPDLARGKVPEDWWYFPVVARLHKERTGYPTQKPESLLERIILASSNAGDLVADFFCGSGTTPLVATRAGRNFLACDGTWRAIHTTRNRLVDSARFPFTFQRDAMAIIPTGKQNLHCERDGNILRLTNTSNLDYWEIDPDWNGSTFQSRIQAHRPNRSGELSGMMTLPMVNTPICIRAVTISGDLLVKEI